jgi:Tfp pilus assembly protein PilN
MAIRQINMIPANILARTALARHLGFWGKGLVFIVLLFVFFYIAQANGFSRQQKAHHSDASMKVQVTKKINQAQKASEVINLQMQDLKLKSGLLATLTNQQPYYDVIATFAETFNEPTWIDHLSIQRGNQKDMDRSNLMVDGFSQSHNTLGSFLESLSNSPGIQDAVLVYAKKLEQTSGGLDASNYIQFKLTCSIVKGSSK